MDLYRVALNVIRNRQRTARRRRYDAHIPLDALCLHGRFPMLVDSVTPASLWEASDRKRRLRVAIRELPSVQRRALMMWTCHGLSLRTIARSTGVSLPVARRTLQHATHGVRTAWQNHAPDVQKDVATLECRAESPFASLVFSMRLRALTIQRLHGNGPR